MLNIINVKFHGPTNTRGSRYVASIQLHNGRKARVTRMYDHARSAGQSALLAAIELAAANGMRILDQVNYNSDSVHTYIAAPFGTGLMLRLSTDHIGGDLSMLADPHTNGWILRVEGGMKNDRQWQDELPTWLKPIYRHALALGCFFIDFDSDADILERFPTYDPREIK